MASYAYKAMLAPGSRAGGASTTGGPSSGGGGGVVAGAEEAASEAALRESLRSSVGRMPLVEHPTDRFVNLRGPLGSWALGTIDRVVVA